VSSAVMTTTTTTVMSHLTSPAPAATETSQDTAKDKQLW
jgi:hypothetical protein